MHLSLSLSVEEKLILHCLRLSQAEHRKIDDCTCVMAGVTGKDGGQG